MALGDILDVAAATVETPEVLRIKQAVDVFVASFDPREDPPNKLLFAAKGDYGTGKTHLMLYARDRLRERMAPVSAWTVLAASSEAPIEDWFAAELGPVLMGDRRPRELVRQLLTEVAAEVAAEDPFTRHIAEEVRSSRKALYARLRDPQEFDASEVDSRFSREVAALCAHTLPGFNRAIEALRWEETADTVEEWLAGHDPPGALLQDIGVRADTDRAVRATNAILVLAALSRRLGQPFALFIDEFEHLVRHDGRHRSRRNVTWVKRLVEGLARRGAMVVVSGHFDAWKQKGDFLDRFMGQRPLELVRLDAKDVMGVVMTCAEGWEGFGIATAEIVVDATNGNIRRVMTLLFDLYNDPECHSGHIRPAVVAAAAARRLQPGTELGIIPAIEAAALAAGATFQREAPGADLGYDATLHRHGILRLVVRVAHVRDEVALVREGGEFAQTVRILRKSAPEVQGLFIALGAVIEGHLASLDAAYPNVDVVNGEAERTIARLPAIVSAILRRVAPDAPAQPEALEKLRVEVVGRAETKLARSEELFAPDERAQAVRSSTVADRGELDVLKASSARDRAFKMLIDDAMQSQRRQLFIRLSSSLKLQMVVLAAFVLSAGGIVAIPVISSEYLAQQSRPAVIICLCALFAIGLVIAFQIASYVRDFGRFRLRALTAMFDEGAPIQAIERINNELNQIWSAEPLEQAQILGARLVANKVDPAVAKQVLYGSAYASSPL